MAASSGVGDAARHVVALGILLALEVPLCRAELLDVLEKLVAGDRFQQSPQVGGKVDAEFALGIAAVEGSKGRLHDVLGILATTESPIHLALDQLAESLTIAVVHIRRHRIGYSLKTRNNRRSRGHGWHVSLPFSDATSFRITGYSQF